MQKTNILKKFLPYFIPIVLLVGIVIGMQYHAIPYWVKLSGRIGILLSILLELLALWLWFSNKLFLGLISSVLLLSGPLIQVTEPFVDSFNKHSLNKELIVLNKHSLETLENNVDILRREKWAGMLKDTQRNIQNKEHELQKLMETTNSFIPAWKLLEKIIMISLLLILLLLSEISLLNYIRKIYQAKNEEGFILSPELPTEQKEAEENQDLYLYAAKVYQKLIKLKNHIHGTWSDIAKQLEIPASNISRIKNALEAKPDAASYDMIHRVELALAEKGEAFHQS